MANYRLAHGPRMQNQPEQDWAKGFADEYQERWPPRNWKNTRAEAALSSGSKDRDSQHQEDWQKIGPYSGLGPGGYQRSDELIVEHIYQRMTRHGYLNARYIRLEVKHGLVILRGIVEHRRAKKLAENIAYSVPGVQDVRNELFIQPAGTRIEAQARPRRLDSLKAFFIDELRDLYDAEQQILQALPRMAEAAQSPDLKRGFEEHRDQTQRQIERLERIFSMLEEQPEGHSCLGMRGIIQEAEILMQGANAAADVMDAALIVLAQKMEHYEIAGYGSVRTYAGEMGLDTITKLLQQTLDEEAKTNERLTSMAVGHINLKANKEIVDTKF